MKTMTLSYGTDDLTPFKIGSRIVSAIYDSGSPQTATPACFPYLSHPEQHQILRNRYIRRRSTRVARHLVKHSMAISKRTAR